MKAYFIVCLQLSFLIMIISCKENINKVTEETEEDIKNAIIKRALPDSVIDPFVEQALSLKGQPYVLYKHYMDADNDSIVDYLISIDKVSSKTLKYYLLMGNSKKVLPIPLSSVIGFSPILISEYVTSYKYHDPVIKCVINNSRNTEVCMNIFTLSGDSLKRIFNYAIYSINPDNEAYEHVKFIEFIDADRDRVAEINIYEGKLSAENGEVNYNYDRNIIKLNDRMLESYVYDSLNGIYALKKK